MKNFYSLLLYLLSFCSAFGSDQGEDFFSPKKLRLSNEKIEDPQNFRQKILKKNFGTDEWMVYPPDEVSFELAFKETSPHACTIYPNSNLSHIFALPYRSITICNEAKLMLYHPDFQINAHPCTLLTSLNLKNITVGRRFFENLLPYFPHLEELFIPHGVIENPNSRDAGSVCASMPKLKKLCWINDPMLRSNTIYTLVRGLNFLEYFNISHSVLKGPSRSLISVPDDMVLSTITQRLEGQSLITDLILDESCPKEPTQDIRCQRKSWVAEIPFIAKVGLNEIRLIAKNMPHLTQLSLMGADLNEDAVELIVTHLNNVEILKLKPNNTIIDKKLLNLQVIQTIPKKLTNLRVLFLENLHTDNDFYALIVQHLKNLEYLDLSKESIQKLQGITYDHVVNMIQNLVHLKALAIKSHSMSNDEQDALKLRSEPSLESILKHKKLKKSMSNLTNLQLYVSVSLTYAGIHEFY